MNLFDRIFALHSALSASRHPVSRKQLEEQLECSQATVKRVISNMRDYLNAPIEYDAERNGYFYAEQDQYGPRYELPGLWFNDRELAALLGLRQLLSQLEPGLLNSHLDPLDPLLDKMSGASSAELHRIRILSMAGREPGDQFGRVAEAVLSRKQMTIEYHARSSDEQSSRRLSPQRLTHYRDNWFVDAWCHERKALRTFSIDRISSAQILEENAQDVTEQQLDETLGSGYGIFSGPPTGTAVIKVSKERARWVAEEQWHPQQTGVWQADGCYLLSVPYGRSEELLGDILRLGPQAEVIEPAELRGEIQAAIKLALSQY
jgi:proteasome accessory factor C